MQIGVRRRAPAAERPGTPAVPPLPAARASARGAGPTRHWGRGLPLRPRAPAGAGIWPLH